MIRSNRLRQYKIEFNLAVYEDIITLDIEVMARDLKEAEMYADQVRKYVVIVGEIKVSEVQ